TLFGRQTGVAGGFLNTGGNIGGGIAPVLTPMVAQAYGWPAGLFLGCLVALLGLLAWLRISLPPSGAGRCIAEAARRPPWPEAREATSAGILADHAAPRENPSPLPRAWLTVALLWVVGCLNYLDRLTITTMHTSLKAAIPMTEAQFGLLTTGFLIVYAVASP